MKRQRSPHRITALLLSGLTFVTAAAEADAQRKPRSSWRDRVGLEHLDYRSGLEFHSKALGQDAEYGIFLPKDYDASSDTRYPVIYFLHGMWEDSDRFRVRGGGTVLDSMVGKGEIPPHLFVCVNDDTRSSFYINGKSAKVEDMILEDLIPHIEKTYRTLEGREGRALLGVSMGGFGALKIAFKHPELFRAVASHSAAILPERYEELLEVFPWARDRGQQMVAAIFGDPVDQTLWAAENPLTLARALDKEAMQGLKVYFDCGDKDRYGFHGPNAELHAVLKKRGIPHVWRLVEGGNHGWNTRNSETAYNAVALPHSLRFLAGTWIRDPAAKGGTKTATEAPQRVPPRVESGTK